MLGVDIVNIPEFFRSVESGGDSFLQRTFVANELSNKKIEHLAGIFAAKEAVGKALSLPVGSWLKIEIKSDGKPRALIDGQEKAEISISHHIDYAIAIAMEKNA